MMPRRPHPADEFNAGIIAAAIEWTAHLPAGDRPTERFADRPAAEAAARRLAARFRRPALVYAVNAAGRSALAATINPEKENVMPKATKPAVVRAAKAPTPKKTAAPAKAAKPAAGRRAAAAPALTAAQAKADKSAPKAAFAKHRADLRHMGDHRPAAAERARGRGAGG